LRFAAAIQGKPVEVRYHKRRDMKPEAIRMMDIKQICSTFADNFKVIRALKSNKNYGYAKG
jgi:uncharacterized protein with von Willebrand factor type A (vWA) domain